MALMVMFMFAAPSDVQEYCPPFDSFTAQCSSGEVILITHAKYGAIRVGKCIEEEIGITYVVDYISFNNVLYTQSYSVYSCPIFITL